MTKINELNQEITELSKKATVSHKLIQTDPIINQELLDTQEVLGRKQKELSKLRTEVIELKAKLRIRPEPDLPQTEPISPWLLGVILVAGVGLL
ncbi:167_t:CDS:2 [Entrophospora sp. SA101]|nr:167_t:CDS:2 [Entrophospora sp. SA101]